MFFDVFVMEAWFMILAVLHVTSISFFNLFIRFVHFADFFVVTVAFILAGIRVVSLLSQPFCVFFKLSFDIRHGIAVLLIGKEGFNVIRI